MSAPTDTVLEIGRLATVLADGERRFELLVEGLRLAPGDMLAVTGQSGTGKTLFLELLGLLRRPAAGADYSAAAAGARQDLAALWQDGGALARTRGALFGFVPQTGALIPFLTVAENAALTQRVTGRPDPGWAAHLLDRLGLAQVARLRPAALSIGQRQRLSIARALAHRPAFVIADEPTAALDPGAADTVMSLLMEQAREAGAGVILSSHDLARVAALGLRRLDFQSGETSAGGAVSRATMIC